MSSTPDNFKRPPVIVPTFLYHLPPFLLTSLPPSPQPVPSTHAPSRNPVCSLRRSLTVYYLGLASRSFLSAGTPRFQTVENDDDDHIDDGRDDDDNITDVSER